MPKLIFSLCKLSILYLIWFLSYVSSVSGIQDVKQTTLDIDNSLKYNEDKANEQLQKNKFCDRANITIRVDTIPGSNVILVNFKLSDEKFDDCFKYFNIVLKKKRITIKKVLTRYLHEKIKVVSHRFENLSCGIYEVLVQPCKYNRSCSQFMWEYGYVINVTSEHCAGILQNKIFPNENISGKIFLILSVTVFLLMIVVYGFISYCYFSGKFQFKKFGKGTNVTEPEYVRIATSEVKFINIYIFHKYDKGNVIKNKAENLKKLLSLLVKHLFDVAGQRGLDHSLYSSIKLISSDLSKILFNVDDWLSLALKLRIEDDSLRKIILIESEIEEEEEDSMENLIFSEFKGKLKTCTAQYLDDYDSLFVVRLSDIPTYSKEFENIVGRSRYVILSDLIDLCLDIFSDSGLFVSEDKRKLKVLLQECLAKHLNSIQWV